MEVEFTDVPILDGLPYLFYSFVKIINMAVGIKVAGFTRTVFVDTQMALEHCATMFAIVKSCSGSRCRDTRRREVWVGGVCTGL